MSFIKQNYDEKSYYIHIIDTYIPADNNYATIYLYAYKKLIKKYRQ